MVMDKAGLVLHTKRATAPLFASEHQLNLPTTPPSNCPVPITDYAQQSSPALDYRATQFTLFHQSRKPRMVARSSVNSRQLIDNPTLAPGNCSTPDHQITGTPHQLRRPYSLQGGLGGSQGAGNPPIVRGQMRPVSTTTLAGGQGGDPNSHSTYSFYPPPIGAGATGMVDEQATELPLDYLLQRKTRPNSGPYLMREKSSASHSLVPRINSSHHPPIIGYQQDALKPLTSCEAGDHEGEEPQQILPRGLSPYIPVAKTRVELVLIFVKVGQVDTVNERYQADVFLQARWREPLLDATWSASRPKHKKVRRGKSLVENPFTDLAPRRHLHTLRLQDDEFWNPRLLLDNAQGEPMEFVSHEVEFVEPDFEAYLIEKRRIKGIFHETLELRHFPFDCQDLSVTVTCDRTVDEVELVPSPTEVSQVDRRCASDSQEWNLFHHVDISSMEIQTAYSPGNSKRRHPGLVFTSRSARRSGYFMVNMALISCVLCLLSFVAFSVPANENRLQLSLLLLLTTVTFKFAASQNLPKIPYLTYLDKVVLANFFMLVILTVWHSIARQLHETISSREIYVVSVLLSCYCIGAVVFGLTVYIDAGSRRRMMKKKDAEFVLKKERIEKEKENCASVSIVLDEWLTSSLNTGCANTAQVSTEG